MTVNIDRRSELAEFLTFFLNEHVYFNDVYQLKIN